jgi:hypothetical protein
VFLPEVSRAATTVGFAALSSGIPGIEELGLSRSSARC